MSVINTNILSLNTQQNLKTSKLALNSAIERLSSGLRINNAKDDAAGQAIANKFTSQIRGLQQASRNAADGMSLAQTAEGGLKEINNNLQRIRELTVQASNDTNSDNRGAIQQEITQRLEEIDRVAGQTKFNGTKVLDNANAINIQVGANDGETIALTGIESKVADLGMTGFDISKGVNTGATDSIATIDAAITTVDGFRSQLGAAQNRFESAIANIGTTITNLSSSRSAIEDADYATEVSNMSRAQILQQAGTSVLSQANQTTQGVLNLLR